MNQLRTKIGELCADEEVFMPGDSVDLTRVSQREAVIKDIKKCVAECQMIEKFLRSKLQQVDRVYQQECDIIAKFPRCRFRTPLKPVAMPRESTDSMKLALGQLYPGTDVPAPTKVAITSKIALEAVVCNSLEDVVQPGVLYFIPSWGHFACEIAGVRFHGNIGRVFTSGYYHKIKDCRYVGNCAKGPDCPYYHDPMIFQGSKDCRNYLSGSWLYGDGRARPFGSRERLDIDILTINDEEIARLGDQVMHDLLCYLVLVNRV